MDALQLKSKTTTTVHTGSEGEDGPGLFFAYQRSAVHAVPLISLFQDVERAERERERANSIRGICGRTL